jgi:hypothetical protein
VHAATVTEFSTAEQEALLRELVQIRYGHFLAIHILLLLTAGKKSTEIADFLFCSRSSVYRAVNAYRAGELDWQREDPGASPRLLLQLYLNRGHKGLGRQSLQIQSLSSSPSGSLGTRVVPPISCGL